MKTPKKTVILDKIHINYTKIVDFYLKSGLYFLILCIISTGRGTYNRGDFVWEGVKKAAIP